MHAFKLLFLSAYIVTNLVLLKKQINLGLLILVILLEGLLLGKFQYCYELIALLVPHFLLFLLVSILESDSSAISVFIPHVCTRRLSNSCPTMPISSRFSALLVQLGSRYCAVPDY